MGHVEGGRRRREESKIEEVRGIKEKWEGDMVWHVRGRIRARPVRS